MSFLKGTINDVLTLEADDHNTLTWYIDAAFAVHADMKSHTGSVFTMGKGALASSSTKQKVNSRSSTESELVAMDNKMSKILWAKRFLEWQGFEVKLNIVYQDNTSTMKLGENGKASSGKRTRHFDIKYFYVTDLVDRKELKIEYCSTETMIADYMTKPLTGGKFKLFRDRIMNLSGKHHRIEQQECVGRTVSVSNKHESNESTDASKKKDVAVEVKVPSKNRNTKGSDPKNRHVNKNVKESDSANESVKGLEAKDSPEKGSRDLKVRGQKE
jgi:hypothetical protein